MQARVRRGFIPIRRALIGVAFLAFSFNCPAPGYGGTYADVEKCLADNPPPDGCYNYTQTAANSDGQTVYTVYQRCGHVVARSKQILRDPRIGPANCSVFRNVPEACSVMCLNGGVQGTVYNEYQYADTITTYCDGTTETVTQYRVNQPYWSLSFGTLEYCVIADNTFDCSKYDKLLCTIIIDPCEGSKDPCCGNPCCGNTDQCSTCGSFGGFGGSGGGGSGGGNGPGGGGGGDDPTVGK